MPQFLSNEFLNNTILDYLIFLATIVFCLAVIKIVGSAVIRHVEKRAKSTETEERGNRLAQVVKKYLLPILYFTAFYFSTKILTLSDTLAKIIDTIVLAFIMLVIAMFVSSVVTYFFRRYWDNKIKEDENNKLAFKWITGFAKAVIWGIVLVLFLDNVGVEITSLVTGLGIGGIAIAFAAQAILGDVFCFFTIFFDKPFEIGDFIIAGEQMGTVEHIGVKTTRLRSLNGEQMIFSNTDLTNSRIQNYKTMEQRRVRFTLGVTYDTPHEKLKEIPDLIKSIVEEVPDTVFGRTHFSSYGAYSLNFEIVYYIVGSDYDKYMDINQTVNLRIKEEFGRIGVEFAFPTQTIDLVHAEERALLQNNLS